MNLPVNKKLIQKLKYSFTGQEEIHPLSMPLKESLQIISDFFVNNSNNKLCLVFPTKEFAAQWLSVPTVLCLIESDFSQYKNEIIKSLETYKKNDRIILNNEAVVDWIGKSADGFVFRHKEFNGVDTITIDIKKISKIQPAPVNRKALSGYKRVIEALNDNNENPVDKILGIQSFGNKLFQKNSICLISKHISFENSISEISLNNFLVDEYFKHGKIDESGEVETRSPLVISNNLCNLALYLTLSESVSKIIIDGFSAIQERAVDFNDIDVKKIPTILITDLSEIETFENIGDYGFDFFNFTKENLQLEEIEKHSPFSSFDEKLKKYITFNLRKEICSNTNLESITQLIHSIETDESVKELVNLKISLIQLTNFLSRIVHPLSEEEISFYKSMLRRIESQFIENRFYLGGSVNAIEESISSLSSVLERFIFHTSEKCLRFSELMKIHDYDYIICTTEDETKSLSTYIKYSPDFFHKPKVISVAEINNKLLSYNPVKAILTGWAKSNNINRILSSFLFSELTVLFYQFECRYFNSLQNRNMRFSGNVKSTIRKDGIHAKTESEKGNGFIDLYKRDSKIDDFPESNFDISTFELKLDNAQFSKYIVKENMSDSIKAKRVEFKNDKFIYLTETHGLLVLENFYQSLNKSLYIHKSRIENLHPGDVIAFMKTEREVLNDIVGKLTTPADLNATTKWIELWKDLLRKHYLQLDFNFNKLVEELREKGCTREPVTIRSWLLDELRIGPRKDEDLISIALMTNGTELYNHINEVRKAIKQMTGWRMKASDYVIEQLKSKIKKTYSSIQVNSTIDFEDFGEVEILEIVDIKNSQDFIDIRNVNRLLEKTKL